MIDMVGIANLNAAIIAFAFLGFVLPLNIFGGMKAFGIVFASAAMKLVKSNSMGVCGFPNTVTFFYTRTEFNTVSAISSLNKFWMGRTKAPTLLAYALFVDFIMSAIAFVQANFAAWAQCSNLSIVTSKIFSCRGLCLTTLGACFCGIIEAHRNLPFLCQAGDVSQTLPGISIGFTPVSISQLQGVSQ